MAMPNNKALKSVEFYHFLKNATYNKSENYYLFPMELNKLKLTADAKMLYMLLLQKVRLSLPDVIREELTTKISMADISATSHLHKDNILRAFNALANRQLLEYKIYDDEITVEYCLYDYRVVVELEEG